MSLVQFVRESLDKGMSMREAQQVFVREWIQEGLSRSGNNQCVLAERLHVHRNTVSRIMKQTGVIKNGRQINRDMRKAV